MIRGYREERTETAGGSGSLPPSSSLHLHPTQTSVWIQLASRQASTGCRRCGRADRGKSCIIRCTICLEVWYKVLAATTLTPKTLGSSGAEESFVSCALSKLEHQHVGGPPSAIVCGPPIETETQSGTAQPLVTRCRKGRDRWRNDCIASALTRQTAQAIRGQAFTAATHVPAPGPASLSPHRGRGLGMGAASRAWNLSQGRGGAGPFPNQPTAVCPEPHCPLSVVAFCNVSGERKPSFPPTRRGT